MCCCVQTGTLTEGDLDLAGVCEVRDGQFQESVADPQVGKLYSTVDLDCRLVSGGPHVLYLMAVLPTYILILFSFVLSISFCVTKVSFLSLPQSHKLYVRLASGDQSLSGPMSHDDII